MTSYREFYGFTPGNWAVPASRETFAEDETVVMAHCIANVSHTSLFRSADPLLWSSLCGDVMHRAAKDSRIALKGNFRCVRCEAILNGMVPVSFVFPRGMTLAVPASNFL